MMHNSPMWPISGHYRCRACGRNFVVSWAGSQVDEPVADVYPDGTAFTERAA